MKKVNLAGNLDELLNRCGGRGQCSRCGEWHPNVAFHEAHDCKAPIKRNRKNKK